MRPLATFAAAGEDISLGRPQHLPDARPASRPVPELGTVRRLYDRGRRAHAVAERVLLILQPRLSTAARPASGAGPCEWHLGGRPVLGDRRPRGGQARTPTAGAGARRVPERSSRRLRGPQAGRPWHVAGARGPSWTAQLIEVSVLVGQNHLVAFVLHAVRVRPEPGLEPIP